MSVKEIRDILNELNEPNEYQLEEVDLVDDTTYYVWKVSNIKIKNLRSRYEKLRPVHARYHVFINGQFIIEDDYVTEQIDNDLFVKFKKANFDYALSNSDIIVIEGDLESV